MADSTSSNETRPPHSPDDALPPVQPPSGAFVLQLFFIPLLIVALIVCVWLVFSWLAHVGSDPQDLVRDLRRLNDSSWQKALNLANLLRNPEFDKVKDNSELCGEIAKVLENEIAAGKMDEARLRLRIFLCRALGEFRVADGVPTLIKAATEERDPAEISVRAAAVEAIAVLADKVGSESLRKNEALVDALNEAASSRSEIPEQRHVHDELRSRAAFTLGVIGGEASLSRLEIMLGDSNTNVRYNATVALARNGDYRATPGLLEMLQPSNEHAVNEEKSKSEKQSKLLRVQNAALDGVTQLWKKTPAADAEQLSKITAALEKLRDESTGHIHSKAEELLIIIKKGKKAD